MIKTGTRLRKVTSDICNLYLFRIDEETEDLMDCLVKPPLTKKHLKTNQCFVLDNTVELYLWIGEKCNKYHIEEAMECFKACMRSQVRPMWMVVGKVFEGFEPELFRLKFPDWYDRIDIKKPDIKFKPLHNENSTAIYKSLKDMTYTQITPRKINIVALECYKVLDDITCVKYKAALEGFLNLDDTYVFVIVYQIPKVRKDDDEEEEDDDEINIHLYYWQSRQRSTIKWSKFLNTSGKDLKEFLEQQFHTKSSMERVFSFEEPILLQQSLKFNIKYFNAPEIRKKLFKFFVEPSMKSVKMIQTDFEAQSLCSRYVYLLLDGQQASIWTGSGASKAENKLAIEAANDMIRFLDNEAKASVDIEKVILGKTSLTYLTEKKETDAFWNSLKGKGEYGASNESQANPFPVVLVFEMTKGLVDCRAIELTVVYTGLAQSILDQEKIILIDCGSPRPCHLWMGSRTGHQFRIGVHELLKLRFKDNFDDRSISEILEKKLIAFSYSQEKLNELRTRRSASSLKEDTSRPETADKISLKPESVITKSSSSDKTEAVIQHQVQQYTNAVEGNQISPYAVQRMENLRNIMNMRKKKETGSRQGAPIIIEEEGRESLQFRSYFLCWNYKPQYLKLLT
eukprot:NODE_32_length_37098_cov_1.132760.p6 type:complete len:626 gc:universal NODE_32_length_37098_cov_1.132760:14518-12641(-)